MKITLDNYKECCPSDKQGLMEALLIDIKELPSELEIHYVTEHTEYSCERTDPCPDYYHTYFIKWAECDDNINSGLTLEELDNHLCTLCLAFEQLSEIE